LLLRRSVVSAQIRGGSISAFIRVSQLQFAVVRNVRREMI